MNLKFTFSGKIKIRPYNPRKYEFLSSGGHFVITQMDDGKIVFPTMKGIEILDPVDMSTTTIDSKDIFPFQPLDFNRVSCISCFNNEILGIVTEINSSTKIHSYNYITKKIESTIETKQSKIRKLHFIERLERVVFSTEPLDEESPNYDRYEKDENGAKLVSIYEGEENVMMKYREGLSVHQSLLITEKWTTDENNETKTLLLLSLKKYGTEIWETEPPRLHLVLKGKVFDQVIPVKGGFVTLDERAQRFEVWSSIIQYQCIKSSTFRFSILPTYILSVTKGRYISYPFIGEGTGTGFNGFGVRDFLTQKDVFFWSKEWEGSLGWCIFPMGDGEVSTVQVRCREVKVNIWNFNRCLKSKGKEVFGSKKKDEREEVEDEDEDEGEGDDNEKDKKMEVDSSEQKEEEEEEEEELILCWRFKHEELQKIKTLCDFEVTIRMDGSLSSTIIIPYFKSLLLPAKASSGVVMSSKEKEEEEEEEEEEEDSSMNDRFENFKNIDVSEKIFLFLQKNFDTDCFIELSLGQNLSFLNEKSWIAMYIVFKLLDHTDYMYAICRQLRSITSIPVLLDLFEVSYILFSTSNKLEDYYSDNENSTKKKLFSEMIVHQLYRTVVPKLRKMKNGPQVIIQKKNSGDVNPFEYYKDGSYFKKSPQLREYEKIWFPKRLPLKREIQKVKFLLGDEFKVGCNFREVFEKRCARLWVLCMGHSDEKENLTNVKLMLDDYEFSAHREILFVKSRYFKEELLSSSTNREEGWNKIQMGGQASPQIDRKAQVMKERRLFRKYLEFTYKGKLDGELTFRELAELLDFEIVKKEKFDSEIFNFILSEIEEISKEVVIDGIFLNNEKFRKVLSGEWGVCLRKNEILLDHLMKIWLIDQPNIKEKEIRSLIKDSKISEKMEKSGEKDSSDTSQKDRRFENGGDDEFRFKPFNFGSGSGIMENEDDSDGKDQFKFGDF